MNVTDPLMRPVSKIGDDCAPDALSRSAWWRGAVIYQIYPRSFRDTNDDGVGDLPGVLEGLDYVASLGVDGVWLSPFFTSPMHDFGYDVADYCDVDPIFGALSDFDRIVARTHALGMKIIIDQVYSHTSSAHGWFTESRRNRSNPKADWYVWADPRIDGTPPNNWQSVFGGPAWTWDSRRGQYYLHNFLPSQPDLNLHNKEVQDALLDVAHFWLDRGVDGFRLDAINFGMHDLALRDNPPASSEGRRITRPFDMQRQIYNQSHPEMPQFLERIRKLMDSYPDRFTVAEVGGPSPLAEMKAFTSGDRRLNSAYGFDFLYADRLTSDLFRVAMNGWPEKPEEGWPSWAFSNHDAPRAVSRWAAESDRLQASKLYAMLLLSLRGNVFLYQGEELGLPQAHVAFEDLKDPEAVVNWPETLGRDGARTPFPWRADHPNAGFSFSAPPWLPVDPRHFALSAAEQERDPSSTLNFVRKMVSMRAALPALRTGAIQFLDAPKEVLAFKRSAGTGEEILGVFNLGGETASWRPVGAERGRILFGVGGPAPEDAPPERLDRLSGYLMRAAP